MVQFSLQRMRAPVAAMQIRRVHVKIRPLCSDQTLFLCEPARLLVCYCTANSRGLFWEEVVVVARICQDRCLRLPLALRLNAVESCSSYYSPAGEQPTPVCGLSQYEVSSPPSSWE